MASFILVRDEVSEPLANFPKEALFYIHEFMTEEVFWREPWNDDMKAKNENGAYSKLKISHLERMRNWVEEEKIYLKVKAAVMADHIISDLGLR